MLETGLVILLLQRRVFDKDVTVFAPAAAESIRLAHGPCLSEVPNRPIETRAWCPLSPYTPRSASMASEAALSHMAHLLMCNVEVDGRMILTVIMWGHEGKSRSDYEVCAAVAWCVSQAHGAAQGPKGGAAECLLSAHSPARHLLGRHSTFQVLHQWHSISHTCVCKRSLDETIVNRSVQFLGTALLLLSLVPTEWHGRPQHDQAASQRQYGRTSLSTRSQSSGTSTGCSKIIHNPVSTYTTRKFDISW